MVNHIFIKVKIIIDLNIFKQFPILSMIISFIMNILQILHWFYFKNLLKYVISLIIFRKDTSELDLINKYSNYSKIELIIIQDIILIYYYWNINYKLIIFHFHHQCMLQTFYHIHKDYNELYKIITCLIFHKVNLINII